MTSLNTALREQLKNRKFRLEFKKLEPEFVLIRSLLKKREQKGMTQSALAKKVGTKQSAIARLESGTYNPSFAFMRKIAKALDAQLIITLK